MRLLNAKSKELELLHGPRRRYAIVSHRWGTESEEVLFTDIGDPSRAQSKVKGYDKISCSCNQALKDDLDYVWLDTCCIDKSNNTELTEALNSMYNWYQEAEVCYAYLNDVSDLSQFPESEWFKRGWTLQELIAPRVLKFFNKNWELLGTREELMGIITGQTGVTNDILAYTTRVEDRAYSMLGILGISLPAIYGIGHSAFEELQHKIIARYHDQTLFAWYHIPTPPTEDTEMVDEEPPPAETSTPPPDPSSNSNATPASATEAHVVPSSPNATGILATSPSQFLNAYEISERDFRKNFVDRIRDRSYRSQFSISNNFVHMSVPIKHLEGKIWKAVLRCSLDPPSNDQIQRPLVIYLEEIEHRQYLRTHLIPQEESSIHAEDDAKPVEGILGSLEVLGEKELTLDGYFLVDIDVIGRLGDAPAETQPRPAVEDPDNPSQLSEAERIARLPRHPPGIKTTNIVICGEPGVAAGRVINQILGAAIIKPLTDYERDSMATTPIDSTLHSRNIRIFYITGPRDPYLSVERYHATLKNMYQLVQDVEKAGGIHFMLLCMIGSSVTPTVESNFRLFHDFVCEKQVPMALIITGLGKTTRMDDWWDRHKHDRLSPDVQIVKFDHACITVLKGDTTDQEKKFADSTAAIHTLLVDFIDRLDKTSPRVFRPMNVHQWFVSMGKQAMDLLLAPYREALTEEGTEKVLTEGCRLSDREAKLLVGMMFLSEQQMEERIEQMERQEREEREARERQEAEAKGEARVEGEAMPMTES